MSADSNTTMPALPKPKLHAGPMGNREWFDAGQMREYAQSYAASRVQALQREVEELRKLVADLRSGLEDVSKIAGLYITVIDVAAAAKAEVPNG